MINTMNNKNDFDIDTDKAIENLSNLNSDFYYSSYSFSFLIKFRKLRYI